MNCDSERKNIPLPFPANASNYGKIAVSNSSCQRKTGRLGSCASHVSDNVGGPASVPAMRKASITKTEAPLFWTWYVSNHFIFTFPDAGLYPVAFCTCPGGAPLPTATGLVCLRHPERKNRTTTIKRMDLYIASPCKSNLCKSLQKPFGGDGASTSARHPFLPRDNLQQSPCRP